jgi:hypothetical protein
MTMNFIASTCKRLTVTASLAALISPFVGVTPAITQSIPLTEEVSLIDECRATNRTINIYRESDLQAALPQTLSQDTVTTLTGVMRGYEIPEITTIAQVYVPSLDVVGWVDAVNLRTCTPDAALAYCLNPARFPVPNPNLAVRRWPNARPTTPIDGRFLPGDTVRPTTEPPTRQFSAYQRRNWMEVETFDGSGWVSETGPNLSGTNLVPAPTGGC